MRRTRLRRATSPPKTMREHFKNSVLDTADKAYFDMYSGDTPSPYKREPAGVSSIKEYAKRLREYYRHRRQRLSNMVAIITQREKSRLFDMLEALRRRKERVVRLLFFFESESQIA